MLMQTIVCASLHSSLVVLCCLALFYFFLICNHVHVHTLYNRIKQTEREKQLFSMKGSDCRSQRMAIYSFLLSHMTDAHRFQLTAKLCQEVQEHTNTYTQMHTFLTLKVGHVDYLPFILSFILICIGLLLCF